MHPKTIQDILPLVDQPSRYLGSEVNRSVKSAASVRLRVALAFPDLYEIGTSHFGIQILYHLINQDPRMAAERVFTPADDMERRLRDAGLPLASLETETPLDRFDIIGFSLLYELGYTNMLNMLDLAGIPFFARERDESHPLVIAGGPCTCNPEPVADFFDAMVIGDGEDVVPAMLEAMVKMAPIDSAEDRRALLDRWDGIEGVYVPGRFQMADGPAGMTVPMTGRGGHDPVRRAVVADMNAAPFPEAPIIPFARPVHDRLRIEIARGCTRGCRFCQAGMIYRPVRERNVDALVSLTDRGLSSTGYEDLSLLSLSTGDYSGVAELVERLMGRCEADRVAISLPSLRAGTLTPELMRQIKRVRKTGFTLAPEAGSQRLRDVINKNIDEKDIIETVRSAFDLGWKLIKLYFMVGLPTEEQADLEAIVDLVDTLRRMRGPAGRPVRINVSVGTFVPKPHTPFQWAGQIGLDTAGNKIRWLKDRLKMPGVQFKWQNPQTSLIEGLFSRGDRRLSALLVTAYRLGCRFDGWSDRFRFDTWCQALAQSGVDVDAYTTRPREIDGPLPWDHIDTRVDKAFLQDEWRRALGRELTSDCRSGECNRCGACDFEGIAPVLAQGGGLGGPPVPPVKTAPGEYKTLRAEYQKTGPARYFGHLEMANVFTRAVRRAGIQVKYTEGFHPKPKIAFDDPLPVGLESCDEVLYMIVAATEKAGAVTGRINAELPDGLRIVQCSVAATKARRPKARARCYRVVARDGLFSRSAIAAFEKKESWVINRVRPKKKAQQIDLKKAVYHLDLTSSGTLEMVLAAGPGCTVRPTEILGEIFGLTETEIRTSGIVKTKTLTDADFRDRGDSFEKG
jgi:radical SAM family uncharacterized protein/radical SAM-linked protein